MSHLHRIIPAFLLAFAIHGAAAAHENAAGCDFKKGIELSVHEYFKADKPPPNEEARCSKSKAGGWECHMSGWIAKPEGEHGGNYPVIIFIHGSAGNHPEDPETSRGYICEIANYFVPKGYAMWMPFLRGYGDQSPKDAKGSGFHNTGVSYAQWAKENAGKGGKDSTWYTLDYMKTGEMHDIQQAITYLTSIKTKSGAPFADKNRLALMGHSFGGARVVLATAAHLQPLPKAVIDLSGAAMSWDTKDGGSWGTFMRDAAEHREMPLYIHMNAMENPKGLMDAAIDTWLSANKSVNSMVGGAEMSLYSRFEIPADFQAHCTKNSLPPYWCAHGYFVESAKETARWLPNVHGFLAHYGVTK